MANRTVPPNDSYDSVCSPFGENAISWQKASRMFELIFCFFVAVLLSGFGQYALAATSTGALKLEQKGIPMPSSQLQRISKPQCATQSKVNIVGFWAFPSAQHPAQEGTPITFNFSVKNSCNYPLQQVPWRINRFTETILSGVMQNISAGATVDVEVQWIALPGTHNFFLDIDPNRTIGTGEIKYVLDYRVPLAPRWADWLSRAQSVAADGVNAWISHAVIRGQVNGSMATFPPGCLTSGIHLGGDLANRFYNARVPGEYASKIAAALGDAWNSWSRSVTLPAFPTAFPSFVAYPSAVAPPTYAVPSTLPFAPAQSEEEGALGAENLARAIKTKLGAAATESGADIAINGFAQWFAGKFTSWKHSATITQITGKGPVPSWTILTPAGPVVGGQASARLGGSPF